MAAPDGIVWGSTIGSYGRIGIYRSETKTNDKISGNIEIWFWSKYSVSDSNNTLYYDNLASSGSATTSRGSVSVSTTVNSGSGWSTSNQKKLKTYEYSYTRGTSDSTRYLYAKLADIDRVGGTMYASITFKVPKLPSYTIAYNANGGTGAPGSQTKWYGKSLTLSSAKPTRTGYSFQSWDTKSDGSGSNYNPGASYTANSGVTLYALWKANTYTVSYNANGGTGAPGNQTKTYGVTLVLSDTKPTRTGYSFQGWALSKADADSAKWYYQPGGSCGKNENLTLYAVWKANTYTVSYNANGGTGAPGNQTKTYGKALTLSSTKPTRPNYNFLGWGTSATATSVAYTAGASYTTNSAVTLYALWELAYTKPGIYYLTVGRYDYKDGAYTESTSGKYARVYFAWTTFHNVSSIVINWTGKDGSGEMSVDKFTGKTGIVAEYFGNGSLNPDTTYTVSVTVTDSGGSTTIRKTLPGTKYVMDLLAGGRGISFGKPAEKVDTADFAFKIEPREGFEYPVLPAGTDLNNILTPNVYSGENESTEGIDYVNCPITSGTFVLEVLPAGPNGQRIQRLSLCDKTKRQVYERTYYTSSWSDWYGGWFNANLADTNANIFTNYGTADAARYRRVGNVVELRGVITPLSDIAYTSSNISTEYRMFLLPPGYRPTSSVYAICQGSGTATWMLHVATSGWVTFGRYRLGDAWATAKAPVDNTNGAWLPFQCTFLVD